MISFVQVKTFKMHVYTVIQIVLLVILWIVKSTQASLAFPFLLILCVPVRKYILPYFFDTKELSMVSLCPASHLFLVCKIPQEYVRTFKRNFPCSVHACMHSPCLNLSGGGGSPTRWILTIKAQMHPRNTSILSILAQKWKSWRQGECHFPNSKRFFPFKREISSLFAVGCRWRKDGWRRWLVAGTIGIQETKRSENGTLPPWWTSHFVHPELVVLTLGVEREMLQNDIRNGSVTLHFRSHYVHWQNHVCSWMDHSFDLTQPRYGFMGENITSPPRRFASSFQIHADTKTHWQLMNLCVFSD